MNSQSHRFTNEKLIEILSLSQNATAIYTGEEITIQTANDVMIAFWGKDKTVIGKPLAVAVPELTGQPFLGQLQEVWRTGITYRAKDARVELLVDGKLQDFYFDFTYRAIRNEAGEVDSILHTATDVTELNLGRNLIAHAKEQQEALDREQSLNEELGTTVEELGATNEELAAALEELRATNEELQQAQDSLTELNAQLENRVKERTETIGQLNQELEAANEELMASVEELAAANEELVTTNEELFVSRDNLEKSMVELAASEYRTRSIIESAPFPIGVYTGSEMRITFANKSITDVWGKGDDVVGKLYTEILPELINQKIFKQIEQVYETGISFEARNQHLDIFVDGKLQAYYFNYNFTALKNEAGEIYGVMNTAAEVTDMVLSKQEIEKTAAELADLNDKLKISQDELNLAINAAGMATFDLDPVTGKFRGNDLLKSWFGLQPEEEIELTTATAVIADNDRERVIDAITNALDYASGGDYDTYYTIINTQNPEPRILRAKGKTLFNHLLQPIRLSGVLQDVTEQVTSQDKMKNLISNLAASERKFRSLIKQAPVAINVFRTRELIIESINDKMLETWGKKEDLNGQKFADVLPEIVNQEFMGILQKVFSSGEPYYGLESKAFIIKNGIPEERYFNFVYQPVVEEDGSIDSILQVVTEVTEQVNARKEIADINTRLNIAIDAGGLGSTEVDLATGKMECNTHFKKCFGRSKEEDFTYPDLFEAMLPQYRDKIRNLVTIAKDNHTVYKAEYEVAWPDGSVHWINAHGQARYDHEGNAVKMVGIISDITETKKDEQRKNDFIAMVSHELKTPLTSLTAYMQILHRKANTNGDSFAAGALDKANSQVKKMTTMINGFLNVSRLESGKIHIDSQRFDMALLFAEVEQEFIATVSTHQLVFTVADDTFVNADRDKIGQVINNFISNAVKYSPANGRVAISCKTADNEVIVAVNDEGRGIDENDQQRLFERYYRVKDQPVNIAGFGIGLYLCAEVIYRHNGKIWLESEIGKGSTFYFSLPV